VLSYKSLFSKLFLLFLLTSCASAPQRQESDQFQVLGKISVQGAQNSFSSRFSWRQTATGYHIELWGPLGQGRTQLEGDAGNMTIVDGSGNIQVQGPPEQVMEQHLGWSMPLEVLPQWMLGRSSRDHAVQAKVHDEEGNLSAFEQLNWQVSYKGFHQQDAQTVPRRIDVVRGEYRIRIVVSQWLI
jgi:outer membrane lipoprotein LolB